MAFTSLPIYLDPSIWNQPNQQTQNSDQQSHVFISSTTSNNESTPETQNPNDTSTMAKPGSMAERARLAKIHQPEPALKCPRCDSTNTKFCYYNNYSLSQPRHFCKTCRRYWTRGGALRSVPVGGGCRRNKRGSNSKSSANKSGASSSAAVSSSSNCSTATSGSGLLSSNFSQFPLLSSLHPLADQLGFNFSMMQQQSIDANEYQLGGNMNVQQFPFMDNTSVMSGINYGNFHGEVGSDDNQLGFHMPMKIPSGATSLGLITQMASVKMEDSHAQGMNLSRQYFGISGNDPYMSGLWDGNGNGNVSGFNSTSAGNLL